MPTKSPVHCVEWRAKSPSATAARPTSRWSGIRRGGVLRIAYRLRACCSASSKAEMCRSGTVDINLYRDDASTAHPAPLIGRSDVHFPVDDRAVVLVDDVLFTGRTVRAAIDALLDYGRPKSVQLLALVDRGHRELPIQPDYCGRAVATEWNERVNVTLDAEDGSVDQAVIEAEPAESESEAGGHKP